MSRCPREKALFENQIQALANFRDGMSWRDGIVTPERSSRRLGRAPEASCYLLHLQAGVLMQYSREYTLSSGASLLDSVHKQILVRSCGLGQHEGLIYEGEFLPGVATSTGLHVIHRHPDQASADRQADEEYIKSLAIGWLVRIEAVTE